MNRPIIVVVGETASGKSALAMELAQKFAGEIICADSRTVYTGMDIGTAKPTLNDQAQIQHHLLDVATLGQPFSASQFKTLACNSINDIHKRHKVPIIVGGTGLYVDSVIYDYKFPSAPAAGLRKELNSLSLDELIDRAELLGLSTQGVDTQNKRRVIRLIENNGQLPARLPLRPNTMLLG